MASDLVVPVVRVQNVRSHSNADALDLCDVLGYQMCIPKGKYKGGEMAVYFPADTLIPAEWADSFGIRNFLKGKDKDRVGRVRLRGEPSFGVVVGLPEGVEWREGDNVAEYYGAKKYEPPVRVGCGDASSYDADIDPYFDKFTDVQNGRIFVDVFEDGEDVVVTEKIHGTNCRIGKVKDMLVAGSMEVRRKRPVDKDGNDAALDSEEMRTSTYWFPFSLEGVRNLIDAMNCDVSALLYGEVYGGSVQSLDYGVPKGKGVGFRAFGLKVDGVFLDWDHFSGICEKYGVETVPVLYRGPFGMDKVKELADGKSTMADHMREGVVVYPKVERTHVKIGRAILKYIGTEYELSKHKNSDTKDV